MAKQGYFSDFPTVEYQGKIARNIISRPKIKDHIIGQPTNFYDYTIEDGMRPDQVASYYYGSSEFVWLIFLANEIVDPFYSWPLTQNQLNDFLRDKYGSISAAQALILHYKHNTKGHIISKDTYDLGSISNIVAGQYSPVYAYNHEIEKNEAKRDIKLIDKRLASTAFAKLKEVMIEND
tara:strand:+ start:1135 stop:1671 length:537 start_codon:yes stop_codon:yes gene_type:complete